jgi:hypothetical protein
VGLCGACPRRPVDGLPRLGRAQRRSCSGGSRTRFRGAVLRALNVDASVAAPVRPREGQGLVGRAVWEPRLLVSAELVPYRAGHQRVRSCRGAGAGSLLDFSGHREPLRDQRFRLRSAGRRGHAAGRAPRGAAPSTSVRRVNRGSATTATRSSPPGEGYNLRLGPPLAQTSGSNAAAAIPTDDERLIGRNRAERTE